MARKSFSCLRQTLCPVRDDRFAFILCVVALVGLVMRVIYVVWMRGNPIGPDATSYHLQALALADGHGFVNVALQRLLGLPKAPPVASQPPAWMVLLAVAAKVGVRSVLSQQLLACVVGTATIIMTGLGARLAFGYRPALIAAGLVAVYPNVWVYERELMAETLALLGIATCIWLTYRFLAKPSLMRACALGASIGLLAMVSSEDVALLVLLLLPVIASVRAITWKHRVVWLALAGLTCVLVIAPWSAYNSSRFARPVVLSTGLGETMQAGNCEATYHGSLLGYYPGAFRACRPNRSISKDPSIADGQLRDAAIDFMREHLSRVPVVVAARIGRTFNVFRPFQQVHLEGERGTSTWVLRLALFAYWALIPLAVAGAVIARRRRKVLYPLIAFPTVVLLSVALTIGAVRYRAPAEIPLVLLAAYGIDVVTTRFRRDASSRRVKQLPGRQASSR